MLTVEQIASFRELGFVGGIPVLAPAEVERLRNAFFSLTKVLEGEARKHDKTYGWEGTSRIVFETCSNPHIVSCFESLLGPNLMVWNAKFFVKQPHDGTVVPWHQDFAYWPVRPRGLAITGQVALFDTNTSSGCLRGIPGVNPGFVRHSGERASKEVLGKSLRPEDVPEANAVDIPLKAGEMVFFSDRFIHSSAANESTGLRCCLTMRVSPPEVKVDESAWPHFRWILLHGVDSSGFNRRIDPPTGEDIPRGNTRRYG